MFIYQNIIYVIMSYVVVVPLGKNIDAIYIGIREFPTKRIVLLCAENMQSIAEKVSKDLEKFKIPVIITRIEEPLWEEMFRRVGEIAAGENLNELIINVGAGDQTAKCAAICAAFVNGIKAFDVVENSTMLLPVLKFSYYKLLTDKKLALLRILHEQKDCCATLDDLAKRAKMSLPLISYHINGTLKSEGLKQLGLVDIAQSKGRVSVQLSALGRLLIKNYIH